MTNFPTLSVSPSLLPVSFGEHSSSNAELTSNGDCAIGVGYVYNAARVVSHLFCHVHASLWSLHVSLVVFPPAVERQPSFQRRLGCVAFRSAASSILTHQMHSFVWTCESILGHASRVCHQSTRRSFSRPVVTGNMNDCVPSACRNRDHGQIRHAHHLVVSCIISILYFQSV